MSVSSNAMVPRCDRCWVVVVGDQIPLRMGTFAGGVIVEPSRSFLGSGEVAAVCGLLLHS